MKFNSFLKECQHNEVFKKLSIYVVFSWLLLQVVAVLWQPMGLPDRTVTIVLIILLIGFPLYLFFIWKFQIETSGNKAPHNVPKKEFQEVSKSVMKERQVRRLSAVMFTDIVGYTALMHGDEEVAIKVRTLHREVFQQQHALHHGEIIQYYGDGSLSIFKSAIEAVNCAIAIQRLLREGDPVVPIRIGLHMGDIIYNETEVYGDGVNVASRIESMSVAGAILVSGKINDELKNQHQISTRSLGHFQLKNIVYPLEVFSVTNEGIKVPSHLELKVVSTTSFQRYFFGVALAISILATLAVVFIVRNNFFNTGLSELDLKSSDKIGILHFGNNTGNTQYDIVGKMAADWIMHGITEKGLAQVVSPDVVNEYSDILKTSLNTSQKQNVLQEYFKPSRIISGNYYLNKNELIFQCSITDGELSKTFIALKPISCDSESPLDCIEALKQRILGYLITNEKEALNLQETPPNFEAYQYLLKAKTTTDYQDEYLELLEKAIASDPNYFEPKVLRVAHYYNQGEYKTADSLLKQIPAQFGTNRRQQNLLKLYESLLKGDNKSVFQRTRYEYNLAPFDLNSNASMMVVAMQYVNRPEAVDSIFHAVDMREVELENCYDCLDRIYMKALSELELREYDSVIHYIAPNYNLEERNYFLRPLISAYIRSAQDVNSILERSKLMSGAENYQSMLLLAGVENLLQDNQEEANTYFDQVVESDSTHGDMKNLALALYYKKDFRKAIPCFENLTRQNPEVLENYAYLAIAYQQTERFHLAQEQLNKLEASRSDYQYGEVDYLLARFYASQNEEKSVLSHLLKAVAAGHLYTPASFQHDPALYAYLKKPEFERVMNFWK